MIPESEVIVRRFNVLVPQALAVEQICTVALQLATYVRLVVKLEPEVYFDRYQFTTSLRRLQRQEQMQEIRRRRPIAATAERIDYQNRYTKAPNADDIAKELLRKLDLELHERVCAGRPFYFATSNHFYIWYPRDRAIVSLEPEGPHYVCIHSTDHTVETNTYDWAITMRTCLLGNEKHWRAKANLHQEYGLRGGRDAYPDIVRER